MYETIPRALIALSAISLLLACTGCGATQTSRVALLSDGNLAGRRLSPSIAGPKLKGEDCGMYQHLANAFRNATKGTAYDTLVNVDVTSVTGAFPAGNCIKVEGVGVKSADLPTAEVSR